MNKYLTELIGTFFLVLTIGLTSVGAVAMAPLAIGCTIAAAAFAGGPISGGAFNPAVGIGPTLVDPLVGGGRGGTSGSTSSAPWRAERWTRSSTASRTPTSSESTSSKSACGRAATR